MSTTAVRTAKAKTPGAFWEGLWRSAGIQAVALFVVAGFVCGYQPGIGATAEELAAFYDGDRMRIFIAASIAGLATLNLMWFAAAIRTTLADAGQDGWGAAATASSAAFGALFLLLVSLGAALAYSIAGPNNGAVTSALNDLFWALVVLTSFPRAMLVMSGSFGLWRAKLISNATFTLCVLVVVLLVAGGTTWLSDGVWSPDGIYSRYVSPAICLLWVVFITPFVNRSPAARTRW